MGRLAPDKPEGKPIPLATRLAVIPNEAQRNEESRRTINSSLTNLARIVRRSLTNTEGKDNAQIPHCIRDDRCDKVKRMLEGGCAAFQHPNHQINCYSEWSAAEGGIPAYHKFLTYKPGKGKCSDPSLTQKARIMSRSLIAFGMTGATKGKGCFKAAVPP